jgi:hypothetical protein
MPKALDYATHHLAIIPAAGGEEKVLTLALDRWVIDPRFSPDGKSIIFILEDDATQNVASIPVEGGPVKRWIPFRSMVTAFSISKQGTIAAVVSDPQRPPEVYVLDAWRGAAAADHGERCVDGAPQAGERRVRALQKQGRDAGVGLPVQAARLRSGKAVSHDS